MKLKQDKAENEQKQSGGPIHMELNGLQGFGDFILSQMQWEESGELKGNTCFRLRSFHTGSDSKKASCTGLME